MSWIEKILLMILGAIFGIFLTAAVALAQEPTSLTGAKVVTCVPSDIWEMSVIVNALMKVWHGMDQEGTEETAAWVSALDVNIWAVTVTAGDGVCILSTGTRQELLGKKV